ncbi:hypothetical protein DSM21852_14050 [Methylocystis bryophila]|nr:hypothetical protein DSM21852_14050 [Methylocystis bryophila]
MKRDAFGAPVLALNEDRERLLALLGVASWRPASSELLRHVEGASAFWRRGEKALANIRLAYAGIPRIEDRADAYRLFLAEALLDDGMAPRELTKALGLEPTRRPLVKYDPSQPRVPAGSGPTSGRWSRDDTGASPSAETRRVPDNAAPPPSSPQAPSLGFVAAGGARTLAQALFGEASGSALLAELAVLGETVGAGIVFGAIFVPSPNKAVTEGAVPGAPGLFYHLDAPTGALRLFRNGTAGREIVVRAKQGRNGVFVNTASGEPIARTLRGSLVFDADRLVDATGAPREGTEPDDPKLCPKPEPDTPHGAKEAARAYEDLIKKRINPEDPTPRGWGVNLPDPDSDTSKPVFFDDCRRSDGALIEIKGPGIAEKLHKRFFEEAEIFPKEWKRQAEKQVRAAGQHALEWYFAESEAEKLAKETFDSVKELRKITTHHVSAKEP